MEKKTKKILILAEGYEEEPYIKKILNFPTIRKDIYQFSVVNVKGSQKIVPRFQHEFAKNWYDMILIFCDADRGAKTLLSLVDELGRNVLGDIEIAKRLFIYVNPVTLQLVLSHFDKVKLTNVGKKMNASIVEKLTGIASYDAKQDQIDEMMSLINFKNFMNMKENIKDLPNTLDITPSTNFLMFISRFESKNTKWINDINKIIFEK